ncbi:MAG: PTS mannitol transporter subunit IICB [Enterococcaceae bacterium]|jgi:PTS system mannitol-specific IIC component|nr:PTS mannitol transporter subunit IICB [Enterococcaceae bacterium]MCI1919317.1 PTS mannitol transporter subunit IICB [Enterococcaceae bacterium]
MASIRVQAQKMGSRLSGMVIPNLGAFMAWGILTAIGIALNNELLKEFISPMLNYLLPLLIAFAGGRAVYGYRGGVIGTVATMGAIIGADVTMFLGAMILGPLSAWILKKFDKTIDGKIPTGFELLINNFSVGIIGALIAVAGVLIIAPIITVLTNVMSVGVDWMIEHKVLPFTAIFIEPAKVLFLNNAIGQGILSPLGSTQLAEYGKSVLYLLESNPGPGLGILLGYMIAGKGNSKASAFGASIIHLFGGIHEIYFPFVLMNPALVIALIAGGITSTFLFTLFKVGLVGVASPGSILTIMVMSASGDHLKILFAVAMSALVSFLISIPLIKRSKTDDQAFQTAAKEMENLKGKKSSVSSVFESREAAANYKNMKLIAYACDAGLGSSAMGASVLQKKINKAGIKDVKVFHISIDDLPIECDLIITQKSLLDRVKEKQPGIQIIGITDFINAPEYQIIVSSLLQAKNINGG